MIEFSELRKDNEKHIKDKNDFAKIIGKKDHKLLIGMSCSCKEPYLSFDFDSGKCMGTGHSKDYKNLDNYMKKWEKDRKLYSYLPCIDGKFMDSKFYKEYKAKNKK